MLLNLVLLVLLLLLEHLLVSVMGGTQSWGLVQLSHHFKRGHVGDVVFVDEMVYVTWCCRDKELLLLPLVLLAVVVVAAADHVGLLNVSIFVLLGLRWTIVELLILVV